MWPALHLLAIALMAAALAGIGFEAVQSLKQWRLRSPLNPYRNPDAQIHPAKRIEAQARMGFRLSPIQRFEQCYLSQTGLWQRIPQLTWIHLSVCCGCSGILVGRWAWQLFDIEGLALSGFLLGCLLPLQGLALWKMYRSYQLVTALPSFFGILLRWAQIQPDIYFCFGQLEQSGIHPRLAKPFKRFLTETTSGVPREETFEALARQFEGSTLRHFVKCLERLTAQRGDLPRLLQGFEAESYQLQSEVTKRKLTQVRYKLLINGLCMAAFGLIYGLLKTNRVLSGFYVETTAGKLLLSALSLLVVLSFLGGLRYDQD